MNVLSYMAKKDFADVIELQTLGWGNYPESLMWAQSNHTSL